METDADLALALKLQEEYDREYSLSQKKSFLDIAAVPDVLPLSVPSSSSSSSSSRSSPPSSSISLIDPSLEYSDPTPDIFNMFVDFDKNFFWSSLGSVEVMWSPRMTSCAGICRYRSRNGATTIHLSLPLLKLRPRKDLVETLLHEMIHAYLFVTKNNRDRDGHGPEFQSHMHRINKIAGTHITIYHSFHEEVRVYKTHWWRCNGLCQHQKPFYGLVKRSMNRAPGPNDFWYADHQKNCGGVFIKVKEPENFKSKKSATQSKEKAKEGILASVNEKKKTDTKPDRTMGTITKWVVQGNGSSSTRVNTIQTVKNNVPNFCSSVSTSPSKPDIAPFSGNGKKKVDAKPDRTMGTITKWVVQGKSSSTTRVNTIQNVKNNVPNCCGAVSTSPIKPDIVPFSGKGYTMGKTGTSVTDKPWLKRFDACTEMNVTLGKTATPIVHKPFPATSSSGIKRKFSALYPII